MTILDQQYVEKLIKYNLLEGPCLELGTGYGGETLSEMFKASNIEYYGTDMFDGPNVDFVIDFENSGEEILKAYPLLPKFRTILVMNVLEHTYDPIRILDNIFSILDTGGKCVIITPTYWPIHNYPIDCWRPLPDFYIEYARRNKYSIVQGTFEYVGYGSVINKISNNINPLPMPGDNKFKKLSTRIVNRVFNTYARGMHSATHIAIGVVLKK